MGKDRTRKRPIETLLERLGCEKAATGSGCLAKCPAHDDTNSSLSIAETEEGQALINCFAGCDPEAILSAIGLEMKDLFSSDGGGTKKKSKEASGGFTLKQYAQAKKLSAPFLDELGLEDARYFNPPALKIPYYGIDGEEAAVRFRLALEKGATSDGRFKWRRGDKPIPYGLWRIKEGEEDFILLVEGESDCHTAWSYKLPAIGIPGVGQKLDELTGLLKRFQKIYLILEPDDGGKSFLKRVKKAPFSDKVSVVRLPTKDISDLHITDPAGFKEKLDQAISDALPLSEFIREESSKELEQAKKAATPVLESADPLELVEKEVRQFYGGDITSILLSYVAMTSRVLDYRPGQMPAHLLLKGPSSSGKNFALDSALRQMPPEAFYKIVAGSRMCLIYDEENIKHRAVIFSERDSIPMGQNDEDNPAASALRSLLQDSRMAYHVPITDPETGRRKTVKVEKEGPAVLITTGTQYITGQLGTRLFTFNVPDDVKQLSAAMDARVQIELASDVNSLESDDSLIAFQRYLQLKAPWKVVVRFAGALKTHLVKSIQSPRTLRDFERLLSLIKSVAVIRHAHRTTSLNGRTIAELEDYETVYDLAAGMYESTTTGINPKLRAVVEYVAQRLAKRSVGSMTFKSQALAKALGISPRMIRKNAQSACKRGFLRDMRDPPGGTRPYVLAMGEEPLPGDCGLPSPEEVQVEWNKTRSLGPGLDQGEVQKQETEHKALIPSLDSWTGKKRESRTPPPQGAADDSDSKLDGGEVHKSPKARSKSPSNGQARHSKRVKVEHPDRPSRSRRSDLKESPDHRKTARARGKPNKKGRSFVFRESIAEIEDHLKNRGETTDDQS